MESEKDIISTNLEKGNELNETLFKFNSVKHKMRNEGSSCFRGCLESIFPCLKSIDEKSKRYVFFADLSNVMKFPALYKALLRGREPSNKNFLWWILKSIFQAGVIMFGAIFLFEQNIYLKIVTVTFSVLSFVEILNVYTEIQKFHKVMIISLLGTAITYAITLLIFPEILDVYFIFTPDIIWRILVIAITC